MIQENMPVILVAMGCYYQTKFNLATIGEAEWITRKGTMVQFKNMTEEHIENCIKTFSHLSGIVSAFKLELMRRQICGSSTSPSPYDDIELLFPHSESCDR